MRILVAVPEQPLQEPNAVQVLATCLVVEPGVIQYEWQSSFRVVVSPPSHKDAVHRPEKKHGAIKCDIVVKCCSGA